MKKILLIDLWTDANTGDLALQAGLIRMLRDKHPTAEIVGVFRFGINEFDRAASEIEMTRSLLTRAYGGLRRTYYSGSNHSRYSTLQHKLVSLYSFIELACILLINELGLRKLLTAPYRSVIEEIGSADVVVWKGKNFRCYGGLAGINRQATLLVAGVVARVLSKNVYCVNASIWPMDNVVERWMVETVLGQCKSVSVRDAGSLSAAASLSLDNYFFAHDLSFYYLGSIKDLVHEEKRGGAIALTITKWGTQHDSDRYVKSLIATIRRLIEEGVDEVYIVPQVTRVAESNKALVDQVKQGLLPSAGRCTVHDISEKQTVLDLMRLYARCHMLIGSRMHSCVFARFVSTPFVGIAYDDGPKWDILREFWPAEYIVPYGVDAQELTHKAVDVFRNAGILIERSEECFSELSASSVGNVRDI